MLVLGSRRDPGCSRSYRRVSKPPPTHHPCTCQKLLPLPCSHASLGPSPLCPSQIIAPPNSPGPTLLWTHRAGEVCIGSPHVSEHRRRWTGCCPSSKLPLMHCQSTHQERLPSPHPAAKGASHLLSHGPALSPVVAALGLVHCWDVEWAALGVHSSQAGTYARVVMGSQAATGTVRNPPSALWLLGKSVCARDSHEWSPAFPWSFC